MTKILIYLIFILLASSCNGQVNNTNFSYRDFENQILKYKPERKDIVPIKDFEYGNLILQEVKSAVKKNQNHFDFPDYFNILSAFLTLKESDENIKVAFEKFKNTQGSCEYFIGLEEQIKKNNKYDIVRQEYTDKLEKCKALAKPAETPFDIVEYSKANNVDSALVKIINNIEKKDNKYRNDEQIDWPKQTALDKENQSAIDSLFNARKTYIGTNFVGTKFNSVMWSVIQHSNPEIMEKYLMIIQIAVKNHQLDIVPFKMLLDRFYGLKFGYQFFGTQSGFGFKLADEKTKMEVMKKYDIENYR
jgi:hypothetical protein